MSFKKITLGIFSGNYYEYDGMRSLDMLCSEIIPALTHLIKEQQAVINMHGIEAQQLKKSMLEVKLALDKLTELKLNHN